MEEAIRAIYELVPPICFIALSDRINEVRGVKTYTAEQMRSAYGIGRTDGLRNASDKPILTDFESLLQNIDVPYNEPLPKAPSGK